MFAGRGGVEPVSSTSDDTEKFAKSHQSNLGSCESKRKARSVGSIGMWSGRGTLVKRRASSVSGVLYSIRLERQDTLIPWSTQNQRVGKETAATQPSLALCWSECWYQKRLHPSMLQPPQRQYIRDPGTAACYTGLKRSSKTNMYTSACRKRYFCGVGLFMDATSKKKKKNSGDILNNLILKPADLINIRIWKEGAPAVVTTI